MSLLIQAQTSEDDKEITECLDLVLRSARLGLVHESVDVNHITSYTSKLLDSRPIINVLTSYHRKLVCL